MTFSPGSGRLEDWTATKPEHEPRSDVETAKLWIESYRRQLGRPSMSDDEYERLGHHVYGDPDPEF